MGPFCFMTSAVERVSAILEPVVSSLGYELWHLELEGRGHGQCLRLYIDAPAGIGLEDCERVSREVSAALDVEDPIQSAYRLEVSSPGWDRVLVTPAHFRRFLGQNVRFTLYQAVAGARRLLARVEAAGEAEVTVVYNGQTVALPFSNIARARLEPPDGPVPEAKVRD